MRLVVIALAVALSAGACATGGGDTATSSTTTVPGGPDAAIQCAPFHGTGGPLESSGERPEGLLVDAYVEQVECLDRVTFEFESLGDGTPPGYVLEYRDLERDPLLNDQGGVIEVPGGAALMVRMAPARSTDPRVEDQPATYRGNLRLSYGETHHIESVQKLLDADGAVVWVIGLDGVRPFVVDSAIAPTRISVYIG